MYKNKSGATPYIEELAARVLDRDESVRRLAEEVEALKAAVADSGSQAAGLRESIQAQVCQIEGLQAMLAERDSQIDRLQNGQATNSNGRGEGASPGKEPRGGSRGGVGGDSRAPHRPISAEAIDQLDEETEAEAYISLEPEGTGLADYMLSPRHQARTSYPHSLRVKLYTC